MNGSAGNGDPSEFSSFNPDNAKYDSILGRVLCKMILAKYLPYDPHDYQLDGICSAMDGFDLFATTPTGSGKTGYYNVYARDPGDCCKRDTCSWSGEDSEGSCYNRSLSYKSIRG